MGFCIQSTCTGDNEMREVQSLAGTKHSNKLAPDFDLEAESIYRKVINKIWRGYGRGGTKLVR